MEQYILIDNEGSSTRCGRPFLRHDKSLHPKAKALNSVIPLNYIFQIETFNLSHYFSSVMTTLLVVLSAVTFQPFVEAFTG